VDKTVRIWDSSTGEELQKLEGHSGLVTSVAISNDGTRIVSGSRDETVRIWDSSTGEELQKLEGHSGEVTSVAISKDGRIVVSKSEGWDDDGTTRAWDVATGECLHVVQKSGQPPRPDQYQPSSSTTTTTTIDLSSLPSDSSTVGLDAGKQGQAHDSGGVAYAIDATDKKVLHLFSLQFGSKKRREEFEAKREEARRRNLGFNEKNLWSEEKEDELRREQEEERRRRKLGFNEENPWSQVKEDEFMRAR
jgi:hypothetical protein